MFKHYHWITLQEFKKYPHENSKRRGSYYRQFEMRTRSSLKLCPANSHWHVPKGKVKAQVGFRNCWWHVQRLRVAYSNVVKWSGPCDIRKLGQNDTVNVVIDRSPRLRFDPSLLSVLSSMRETNLPPIDKRDQI